MTEINSKNPILIPNIGNRPALQRTGRFFITSTGTLRSAWSGSQIAIRFEGSAIKATVHDHASGQKGNFLAILLDDNPPFSLALKPGIATYRLAENLAPGVHTLRLFKQTEASVGSIEFGDLTVENGSLLLPPPHPDRRIEFIGDSITCGYGNEARSAESPFSPSTENHYLSYAQIATRELKAECHVAAWSGEGILRNAAGKVVHPLPSIHGQILPPQPEPAWDFSEWIPHAVVINLGTNDFLTGIPDREPFIATYLALIQTQDRRYRSPAFFCCLGPMISDEPPSTENSLTTARSYLQELIPRAKENGIRSIQRVEFQTLEPSEFGADAHPNRAAHRRMATTLKHVVKETLDW